MFINEIWDFKSINMAHELGIAGEFIYDSARKAMALRNLYNDYELNSILYNGAVGIERLQKIYLCLSIPNPMDKSTVPECLKKHNHNELEKHVKEYSGKCISANGRSLLGLFSEYYNNYRYANYVPGYNSKKLKSLFIGFLKKQNGKFDFEELCTAVQFEPFKRYYINELGKTANYYYSLIDEKAREIGTYTYELDSYSNASRVFWSTQRRSLYKQLILEQEAVKELLIHLYKDHGDSGVLKLFNEMHSLEFDDALINDYLADLCEGNVNDCVMHIGDPDQAIYNSEIDGLEDWVPADDHLSIAFSCRYGQEIADVLKALRSGQKSIYAAAGNTGFHPTLIVYDDESRGQVVGKFIAALDNNQLDNPAGIYKVIGAVKNKELKGLKISDYWAEFDDRGSNKKDYRYWSYIDAVAQACCEGRLFIAEQNIRKLLCKIFHYIGAKNKDTCKEFTVSSIKQTLDKEYFDVYRDALITLSTLEDFSRGSIDSLIQDLLQNLCEKKIEEILVALPAYFLEDKDAPIIDKDSNSFIEPLCGRRIQFDTIHGVKGETHDATLILETERSRSSDVKSIFTYFGVGNIQSSSNYNRKCLYVAMSRPRKLLCLAIQDKSYEASKDIFSNWKLIDCMKK